MKKNPEGECTAINFINRETKEGDSPRVKSQTPYWDQGQIKLMCWHSASKVITITTNKWCSTNPNICCNVELNIWTIHFTDQEKHIMRNNTI